jgi:molecular chaperone GrpE (heat shock protein)
MNGYIVKVDDDRTSLIIFESDKFLKENMPQGEDLEKIKYSSSSNNQKTYSRKDITKGVKNIQNSINSVLPTLKGLLIEEGLLDGR